MSRRLDRWARNSKMTARKPKPKPRASGPSRSHAARQAAGRVRVDLYLDETEAHALESLRAHQRLLGLDSRIRATVAQALLDAYEAME